MRFQQQSLRQIALFVAALFSIAGAMPAQVQPAPGWCSMAHCNNQMTDFVPQAPPGLDGGVYVMSKDSARSGVGPGLGCVSNGTNVACSYRQAIDALVYYDAGGHTLWTSGTLLDANTYSSAPIIQTDGSVVLGDDQHIYKFNGDGTVAWSAPNPGGGPVSLVTTPNGAIVSAPHPVPANPCPQDNCRLVIAVNQPGSGYTNAAVTFTGGNCPGAVATAMVSQGQVTAIAVATQGKACIVPPAVTITGDGAGAVATAQLDTPAPIAVYNGTTGALVNSIYLYASGSAGAYYDTVNTPCVNNSSYPNRVYVSTNLITDRTQGALWALDIDPANLANPITPVWSVTFGGPSGASPLCNGDHVYFDGAGVVAGDNVGTTVFGVQDNGSAGEYMFQVSLGAGAEPITCNFAMDPRTVGGFWHQVKDDPKIYHRDGQTGRLIEKIDVSALLAANGALPGTYWMRGVFTTYGTPDHPYMVMSESDTIAGYLVMLDITNRGLVWSLPVYPGNSPFASDTPEGAAALVMDAKGNPILVTAAALTGAYFIANGSATVALSASALSFGHAAVGAAAVPQTVTVTNNSSAQVAITGISAGGDYTQTNTCTTPLPPGISCTIAVTFNPSAVGPRPGSISIADTAAGSPQAIALNGGGVTGQPSLNLSTNQLQFAPQAAGTTSPPQVVALTNTGSAPLAIASIAASGDAVQTNSCPPTLPEAARCLVNAMFSPAKPGPRTGAITITGNAPNSPQAIALSGAGQAPSTVAAGLSATSLVFFSQRVGVPGPAQTVTLSNPGTAVLSIAGITASQDAGQTNTCGSVLRPLSSCEIAVSFTPVTTGVRTGTIAIADNAPDTPQTITISGTGVGNPVPLLHQSVTPAAQLPGAPAFTLTVAGAGFMDGAVVEWNGTPLATNFLSPTHLSATVPAAGLTAPQTAWLNVMNPGPGGGLSNPAWFPIATPASTLTLTRTDLPAGSDPRALAAADFNGDGKLDLAIANAGDNTVSILLGNGDGTFAPAVTYSAGAHPVSVTAADLNGDGKLDLAVANRDDNTVSILLGNGDGTFSPAPVCATGNGPVSVVAADFNGDGLLDLAIANRWDNTVSFLIGKGGGAFVAHMDAPAGQSPYSLAAADFNGDGQLDLAVANHFPGGSVSVLLGHGDGTFAPAVPYATGDSVALIAVDFNGDGNLDLAAVNRTEQTLSVLLGNGDGTFQSAVDTQLNPGPVGLAVGDMHGDGSLEAVVSNSAAGTVSILTSNGDGTFRDAATYATAPGPVGVVAGDFNGDGSLDLAVAARTSAAVSVLLQTPSVVLSSPSLNFGNVAVGSSANQVVTITNAGSALLRTMSIATGAPFSQVNNCGVQVSGTDCSITVTFTPTAAGPQTGVLTITDNAPGPPQMITLSGAGVQSNLVSGGS